MASATFDPMRFKIDNTQVVDYLVSLASALSANGVLDAKDADNLRLLLSSLQSKRERQPIMLEMIEQSAEFLDLLDARYGPTAQAMNLLRHSSRVYFGQLVEALTHWGDKMLERAKLGFNRPLFVYQDGECQRQQLLSTHLIGFTEHLARAVQVINRVQRNWETFYPHDMAGESEIDRAVCEACAEALGFREVSASQPASYPETEDKAQLAQTLATVAACAVDLIRRINQNTGTTTRYPVIVAGDRVRLACNQLREQALPQSGSRTTFEVRRLTLIETLATLVEQVNELSTMTLDAVGRDMPATESRFHEVAPESAKRRVAFVLIVERVAPKIAWQASEALFRYLKEKNVGPEKLIASELPAIHGSLTPKALDTLQNIAAGTSLMHLAGREKARNLNQVSTLSNVFEKARGTITTIILVIACMPWLMGCGLKGPPINDQLEPRPELPFRSVTEPLLLPQNGLKDEDKKESPEKNKLPDSSLQPQ